MNAETPGPQNRSDEYGEIDLRSYLNTILAWWKEIILLAILTALLAGVAVMLKNWVGSPTYAASTDIVVARLVSKVVLDERVRTQTEQIGGNTLKSRRGALVEMALSGVIAQAVIDEMGDLLTDEKRIPTDLIETVTVDVPKAQDERTPSDLIRITVTADDPELAAAIANSWAKHYIGQVNSVFGEVPADLLDSVEAELANVDTAYQNAQKAYEKFVATNRIPTLNRQINLLLSQKDNLQNGRDVVYNTIIKQDRAARIKLFTDLTDAQSQALYRVLNEQSQSQLKGLHQLYDDRDLALRYLDLARNLQEQIRLGGEGAAVTNQQTLQFLKNQVFSLPESVQNLDGSVRLPPNITVITGSAEVSSAAEQETDAQALVSALEQYVEQLNTKIGTASQALLAGDGYQFLDQISTQSLTASTMLTPTIPASGETQGANDLASAILRSYLDLFEIGGLVQLSQTGSPATEQTSLTKTIEQLDSAIQSLRAELAAEESREKILAQKRNLAWDSYGALSNRAAELNIERSSANSEVRLGSSAIPPGEPLKQTDVLIAVAFAGAFGFLAGIVLALIANYLGYSPPLSRQQPQSA